MQFIKTYCELMDNIPPAGGFSQFAGHVNDLGHKLRQIVDLDKASAEDIRRWTLIGIVDLQSRMASLETIIKQQQELIKESRTADKTNQTLTLVVGAIAWIALIVAVAAAART